MILKNLDSGGQGNKKFHLDFDQKPTHLELEQQENDNVQFAETQNFLSDFWVKFDVENQ